MSYWKASTENYTYELNFYNELEVENDLLNIQHKPKEVSATFRIDSLLNFEDIISHSEPENYNKPDIAIGCTLCKKDALNSKYDIYSRDSIPMKNISIPEYFIAEKYAIFKDGINEIELKDIPSTEDEPGLKDCRIVVDYEKSIIYFSSGIITRPTGYYYNDFKDYELMGRVMVNWGGNPQ